VSQTMRTTPPRMPRTRRCCRRACKRAVCRWRAVLTWHAQAFARLEDRAEALRAQALGGTGAAGSKSSKAAVKQ
jgi:hypothetical protein